MGGGEGSPSRTSATSIEQTKKRPTILVLCDWSVQHRSLIKVTGVYISVQFCHLEVDGFRDLLKFSMAGKLSLNICTEWLRRYVRISHITMFI